MTVAVTRTADHTISVATLLSAADGSNNLILPTYLVTSAGTEIGTAASPAYVAPGTSTTWAISAASLPLPSGAATSAKQDTIIGHVDGIETLLTTIDTDTGGIATSAASIDAKIPSLGQALAAGSVPVVLTAAQLSTLTPLSTVAATQSGAWSVSVTSAPTTAVTGPLTDTQLRASAVPVSATQSGTWTVGLSASQTLATVTTVSAVTTLSGGGVAHDGIDSGNPVKVGAKAVAALSTATMVAAADRTDATSDLDGAIVVRPQFPLGDLLSERVTDTGGTSTAFTNFGATASTRNYITAISVYNSSATAGYIDFRDGTAGSVLFTVAIPAGGGAVLGGDLPLFRTSTNTALAYDVSGALSTVYISVSGFKSKV